MNMQWSKVHVLICFALCAAFSGACVAEAEDPEIDTQSEAEEGQVGEAEQAIGDGCNSTDPNWPQCNGGNGPTLPGPDCNGKGLCYCFCRVDHPCGQDPSQCSPLASCLSQCDAQYPSYCTATGPSNPTSYSQCL